VVRDERLEAEVDALVEVLLSKNQQAVRQLKFIINRGVEADLADGGEGVVAFTAKGSLWQQRRGLARQFWSDPGCP